MIGTNEHSLDSLQARFAAWRRTRPRGSRIPETLWRAAVQAAREVGISKTSQGLGVDYYSLKRRLDGRRPAAAAEAPVEFVEIPGKILSTGPGCVVELQDRKGIRLRVELRDAGEAGTLARSLWSGRR
jgi:hypothetical protein